MTRHHIAPQRFLRGEDRWAASPDLFGIVSQAPPRRSPLSRFYLAHEVKICWAIIITGTLALWWVTSR